MTRCARSSPSGLRYWLLILVLAVLAADAGTPFTGNLEFDRPGVDAIGLSLPIEGPISPGVTAAIEYRVGDDSDWQSGPDLLLVQSSDPRVERPPEFAGMVWNLLSGTDYVVRVVLSDTDKALQSMESHISTRSMPRDDSKRPADHVFTPDDDPTAIQAELDAADPGEIFEFRGRHELAGLTVSRSGTPESPIVIRGNHRETAVLGDRSGAVLIISGSHIIVENLTLYGSLTSRIQGTIRVRGTSDSPQVGFTLRRCIVSGRRGLRLWEGPDGAFRDATIYENEFEGKWSWSDIVELKRGNSAQGETDIRSTWNDDGIKLTGQGHSVFRNTFSGFGDTIKIHRDTAVPNSGISIARNLVLWGGDDALELDDGFRNVVAYENMVLNTGTLGSRQPNRPTGGPTYFVRNVGVNQFLRPWKLNDGPSGVHIIHNTIVATINALGDTKETIWTQFQTNVRNARILNNLWIQSQPGSAAFDGLLKFTAVKRGHEFTDSEWDGSAWYPDGRMVWSDGRYSRFADARKGVRNVTGYRGGRFESRGIVLDDWPFANSGADSLGADWTHRVGDFDPHLNISSEAARGAIPLPGYSDRAGSRGAVAADEQWSRVGAR